MDGPALIIVIIMDDLGDDLLLLAVRADGRLTLPDKLRFGLAGSELVRLAAAGRVNIAAGRIEVLGTAPTGDPLLDDALASMGDGGRGPTAKAWVARHRPGLVKRYLARAESAGIVRAERRKTLGFIPGTWWIVVDTGRAAQARGRLEAVAANTGSVDSPQAALAGLASAIGVTGLVFPGRAGAAARKRLREVAKGDPASGATRAATDAASRAATDAAVSAATDAAVNAAVDAATQAAVSAASHAASHAGSHGGAAGGHH